MKTSWKNKKLEDCLDKVVYTNKIQRKDFLESGDFPIISQEAEAINGYWNNEEDLFRSKTPVIIFGDHTQVLKYVDFDFVLGADGVKILSPKPFLGTRFFYYFLQSIDLKSLGYARHYRLLKEFEIPFPPLAEQKRIVKILDEVFEGVGRARENAEKNLKNSRELFESYLQSVFASPGKYWEEKRLGKVCDIGDGNHSSNYPKKSEMVPSGVPFIRGINLVDGSISDVDMRYVSKEKHLKLRKGHLKQGDILFTNRGEIGKMAIVDEAHDGSNLNSQIAWFRCKDEVCNKWLYYKLLSPEMKNLFSETQTGSALQQFTIRQINNVDIKFPHLHEQKTIVKKLDAFAGETKKLEAIYRQKLADLDELKKSVLKKAFAGEL